MLRLGVDYGTSHTVAVLAGPDERIRPLLFDDGTPLLRSAVYADPDGTLLAGRDAVRRARLEPGRFEPHPKQHVDDPSMLLGDRDVPTGEAFAAVLRRVAGEARRVAGAGCDEVVLTCPAEWGPRRRQVLSDAAGAAGLAAVGLVPEPVAAARYFGEVLGVRIPDGRALGVFDLGAGTLDIAVLRRTGEDFEVLATGGLADLGGIDLDAAIIGHLGAQLHGEHRSRWDRVLEPTTTEDRRARWMLWDDVRVAKETLSRSQTAPVHLAGVGHDLHLTRGEFESLARPLLEQAISETRRVIVASGHRPTDLTGLFLVGGSSRVPLVAHLLHAGLGIPPTVLEQPELAVAEGAARSAPPRGYRPPPPVRQATPWTTVAPSTAEPPRVPPSFRERGTLPGADEPGSLARSRRLSALARNRPSGGTGVPPPAWERATLPGVEEPKAPPAMRRPPRTAVPRAVASRPRVPRRLVEVVGTVVLFGTLILILVLALR